MWNVVMARQINRLIVLKKSEERLMKRLKPYAYTVTALSGFNALVLLADGLIDDATVFCWIKQDEVYIQWVAFFPFLFAAWAYVIVNYYSVTAAITQHSAAAEAHVVTAEVRVRSALRKYMMILLFVWSFTVLDRLVESFNGGPVFITSFMQALIMPSQGCLNAIFYGGMLSEGSLFWKIVQSGAIGDLFLTAAGDKEAVARRRRSSMRALKLCETPIVYQPRKFSIFTSSFNQGEASYSEMSADIGAWIAPGHDIYAIGVQECMCLDEFRLGILSHLGGPDNYSMFTTQIGSSNTRLGFHGFIALTVFIRVSDLKSGAIRLVESSTKDVASGANLIVTTAANKGAVGLLFHVHDVTIGFITAHLPSDSKGKSKLPKRNATAQDVLRELVLAPDDFGVDVQLQHDYMIMMGDLNYRMNTPPGHTGLTVLQSIAEAASVEKTALENDSNWIQRKYKLMHGRSDPGFPSAEELALIRAAEEVAAPSWDKVLKQDEMKDMMVIGEVYSGFNEPPTRFPPTYKRKKGPLEGSCGDYSDISAVLGGFSHIGEELPGPAAPPAAALPAAGPTTPASPAGKRSTLGALSEGAEDESNVDEGTAAAVTASAPNAEDETPIAPLPVISSSQAVPLKKAKSKRTSILSAFSSVKEEEDESKPDDEGRGSFSVRPSEDQPAVSGAGGERKEPKKRRTSLFAGIRSAESLAAAEAAAIAAKEAKAKSKIRPPSYTDRILTHSLSDRADKLTVTSYGFCDDIRASDHRPVCMALEMEVNYYLYSLFVN
jgi:hypothetical protein